MLWDVARQVCRQGACAWLGEVVRRLQWLLTVPILHRQVNLQAEAGHMQCQVVSCLDPQRTQFLCRRHRCCSRLGLPRWCLPLFFGACVILCVFEHVQWLSLVSSVVAEPAAAAARDAACAADS